MSGPWPAGSDAATDRSLRWRRQKAPLRQGAGDDWFRFEIGVSRPVGDGDAGVRLPATAYVGPTEWTRFHIDLVGSCLRMTGEPEPMPPLAPVTMPDIEQHGYRVYPLVDHIADKVIATYQLYGQQQRPSTRYKDLVDLVSIATGASVAAIPQLTALASEAERRCVVLPTRFDVPDQTLWEPGYAAEAGRSLLPVGRTLTEALAIVRSCIDPLLDRTAAGTWDPKARRWRS